MLRSIHDRISMNSPSASFISPLRPRPAEFSRRAQIDRTIRCMRYLRMGRAHAPHARAATFLSSPMWRTLTAFKTCRAGKRVKTKDAGAGKGKGSGGKGGGGGGGGTSSYKSPGQVKEG